MTTSAPTPHLPGQSAYIGFEYQVLVTIWLALEFIIVHKADSITIERPSEEDVTAELAGESQTIRVATRRFQIQIKLRTNKLWTVNDLTSLVTEKTKAGKPGPGTRARAFEYLAGKPEEHYLLVTSADVNPDLRPHCIEEIGQHSNADGHKVFKKVDPAIAGRIGILPGEKSSHVRRRIELLLINYCQIPWDDVPSCVDELDKAVRKRLTGTTLPYLKRQELKEVLSQSRGPLLSKVIPTCPENIGRIREQLEKKHVAILVGPPGTGKTTMALMLADEYRRGKIPAKYHHIYEPEHICLIRDSINATGAHVYFIEDPWGQGKPGEKAWRAASELAPLLKQAEKGKTFIVVSRLGPFRESVGDSPDYTRWAVELDSHSYSQEAYREIYERELAGWSEDARANALEVRKVALEKLITPYAVNFFCGELAIRIEKGWVTEQEAVKLAKQSNVHVFGKRLRERITGAGREEIIPALAIWAWLTANGDRISEADSAHLRRLLQSGGMNEAPDVQSFFESLVKSRWLQQRPAGFVVTPSVKEALQSISSQHAAFTDTLKALFIAWADRGEFNPILLCLRAAERGNALVPEQVGTAFDAYLVSLAIQSDPRSFIYQFRELDSYATTDHPAVALARSLRANRKGTGFLIRGDDYPKWTPASEITQELIVTISDSPECKECARKFVVDHLTDGMCHHIFGPTYPRKELIAFLELFHWPLREWFNDAVSKVLESPCESLAYLAEALLDLDPSRLDSLLDQTAAASKNWQLAPDPVAAEAWRCCAEGEEDAWRYGDEDGDERPFFIRQALAEILRRKIAKHGYGWIAGHVDDAELLAAWSRLVSAKSGLEQRLAFVALCGKHGETELAANVIYAHPDPAFHSWAVNALLAPGFDVEGASKWSVLAFANDASFLEQLRSKSGQGFGSAVSLLAFMTLKGESDPHDEEPVGEHYAGFEVLAGQLSELQRKSLAACRKNRAGEPASTSEAVDLAYLCTLVSDWPEIPAIDVLETIAAHGGSPEGLLDRFLASGNPKVRRRAWRLTQSRARLLNEALRDPHHACRSVALGSLIDNPSPQEREAVLAMSSDPSAYVRECLAEQLGLHPLPEGLPVLVELLGDRRDYADQPEYGEERIFTVARTSCTSLRSFGVLDSGTLASLVSFLEGCEASSPDPVVHEKLFEILGHHPSAENAQFCSRYFDSIWLASKWNSLDGAGIVRCCIAAVCDQVSNDPAFAADFDFSRLLEIAEWKTGDDSGTLAQSLIAIGIGHDAASLDLEPMLLLDTFTEDRVRLLCCASKRLRTGMPASLKARLSDQHSFPSFLQWVDSSGSGSLAEFTSSHPDFMPWLKSLDGGTPIDQALHELAQKMISRVESVRISTDAMEPAIGA